MKKITFKILMKDGSIQALDGYLDEATGIALSKADKGGWVSHDYRTGAGISGGNSRLDAIDWAVNFLKINEVRKTESYKRMTTLNR